MTTDYYDTTTDYSKEKLQLFPISCSDNYTPYDQNYEPIPITTPAPGNSKMCEKDFFNNGCTSNSCNHDNPYDYTSNSYPSLDYDMSGYEMPDYNMYDHSTYSCDSMRQGEQNLIQTPLTGTFLNSQIGKIMCVEFLLGNKMIEKTGRLVAVGTNYILLKSMHPGKTTMCDIQSVRFATIIDEDKFDRLL